MRKALQFPLNTSPGSNGSFPSTRKTLTALLIEYTSTSPTAPGVSSTVRSNCSSLSTIFTAWRVSFNFSIAAFISAGVVPNSLETAARISGKFGFLITIEKFFPSGQVFAAPLQNFDKSPSETSVSLLPAAVTTARFFTAPVAGIAVNRAAQATACNTLRVRFVFQPIRLSTFAEQPALPQYYSPAPASLAALCLRQLPADPHEDHCSHKSDQDSAHQSSTNGNAHHSEKKSAYDCSQDSKDQVRQHSIPLALHHLSSQPSRDHAHNHPVHQSEYHRASSALWSVQALPAYSFPSLSCSCLAPLHWEGQIPIRE